MNDINQIDIEDIPENFLIEKIGKKYSLKIGRSKHFTLKIPFQLDMEMSRLCGMIPDGSLSKIFSSVSFSQKKDTRKVKEFGTIIERKFGIKTRYSKMGEAWIVTISNKSLCHFLHSCIDIHKSDQEARIPKWILKSHSDIIKEYLRYAFAMEGSVSDPLKKEKEVRFHSCDKSFLVQVSEVLRTKFMIESYIQKYQIKGYGNKYYLYIGKKDNILKFSEIGFALETHQKRLENIIKDYKAKVSEMTLVSIPKLRKSVFTSKDVNELFPYLSKSAINHRLTDLVEAGFLNKPVQGYSISQNGLDKIRLLKGNITVTKVRTCSKENEKIILRYLTNNESSISQISRNLNIHVKTVRDVLKRLEKNGIIELSQIDKFQRKIYKRIKGR